jgi:S-DNA-T family DNA segregation ATPase FtsK/SpoIIIE
VSFTSFAKATKARYDEEGIRASSNFADAVSLVNQAYLANMNLTRQSYDNDLANIEGGLSRLKSLLGRSAADWTDPIWSSNPSDSGRVPVGVRFGNATFKGHFREFTAPALLPILNQGNLFFVAKGADKKKATDALQAVLLRTVAAFPPGKLRLILIDPVGLGANVSGFMNLPEQVIGNKAWTEPQQIESQLANISEHMTNVIQKYLKNDYKTMEEYNRMAGEVAEPYRFLGVLNFPANFTDAAAKKLVSIAANGPGAGVYVICTIDAELPLPYGFNAGDLLRTGSVVESVSAGQFVWRVPQLDQLNLTLDAPPPAEQFNQIILPVGELAKQGDRVEVPFEKVMSPESEWWKGVTDVDLKAPLGRRGAREIQLLELGQGTQHFALLAGKPGSGKSNLLHVLITGLALKYPPQELLLYLIDFKKGVEFKDYALAKLPHARVIGIESDREFGLSVLKEVQQELNRRGDLFRRSNTQDLAGYRTKTGDRLPRVLVIVDEFQRLFSEDDPLADQASNILAHIVQQGRAFGIHTLLASQTLADAYAIGRATYDKMNVRIALQCTDADSRLILGEDNNAARLLSRPGEAIYNALNGRAEGNNFFQVALLKEDKRADYLARISELAGRAHYQPVLPQVIFEGHVPSKLTSNASLWSTITSHRWPKPKGALDAFLGESTEINPPHTVVRIRPQGRSNILIIGQSERTAYSLLSSVWLSLCAGSGPTDVEFYVVDFSRSDDPWATVLSSIKSAIPHRTVFARPRDFVAMVTQVNDLVKHRIQRGGSDGRRTFFILAGLHRARELRERDEKYGSPGEAAQAMANICREGPDLGVHVISWCDAYGNLTRTLDRRVVSEFDIRVAMQMGEDESNQFIESAKAKTLGPNRAYLYDLDRVGTLEKFRPYELISDDEIDAVRAAFASKATEA